MNGPWEVDDIVERVARTVPELLPRLRVTNVISVLARLGDATDQALAEGDFVRANRVLELVDELLRPRRRLPSDAIDAFLRRILDTARDERVRVLLPKRLAAHVRRIEWVPPDLDGIVPNDPHQRRRIRVRWHFYLPCLRAFRFLVDDHSFRFAGIAGTVDEDVARFRDGQVQLTLRQVSCGLIEGGFGAILHPALARSFPLTSLTDLLRPFGAERSAEVLSLLAARPAPDAPRSALTRWQKERHQAVIADLEQYATGLRNHFPAALAEVHRLEAIWRDSDHGRAVTQHLRR